MSDVDDDIQELAELVRWIAERCWPNLGTADAREIVRRAGMVQLHAKERIAERKEANDG